MRRSQIALVVCALVIHVVAHGASRPDGWDDRTHGRNADPDYARVFAAGRVGRLDIEIAASDWQSLLADMTSMAGVFGAQRVAGPGAGGQGGQGIAPQAPSPEAIAACSGRVVGDACSVGAITAGRCAQATPTTLACIAGPPVGGGAVGGNPPGGQGGAAGGRGANGADDVDIFPRQPIYVPADVRFDGEVFRHVGFRLKGNSSLSNAWRAGVDKLPFRLNFDELEERFPEIRDQTFFGFTNVSFSSNGTDTSFLRHRVVTDLFREARVPAPHTAYMRVYLNRGAGSEYMGLFTMTEIPGSPLLNALFGSDAGNLYKPVGTGGRWTQFFPLSFPKKTNAEDEDWTDVVDAIGALNASRTDATTWRARLEARFEVNGFLRWLALNTIVGNFDAYGGLSAHNYYLYGSPRHRDRLFWMAWDHDLAMNGSGLGAGVGGGGAGGASATAGLDVFLNATASNWPLIRFLLDDPVYRSAYRAHVVDLLDTVFSPERVVARLRAEHALILPFVIGGSGEAPGHTFLTSPAQFVNALPALESYVRDRHAAARAALTVTR